MVSIQIPPVQRGGGGPKIVGIQIFGSQIQVKYSEDLSNRLVGTLGWDSPSSSVTIFSSGKNFNCESVIQTMIVEI